MKFLLICDLDGTLIDSFPGISASLHQTCAQVGIAPLVPIDRTLIGPPLRALLKTVAGSVDEATLERLQQGFVSAYDGGLCCLAEPFCGVEDMLQAVRRKGHLLAVATNKRLFPTRQILRHLEWTGLFDAVETTDSRLGHPRNKAQILRDIRLDFSSRVAAMSYLGDTDADVEAAHEVDMPCILGTWGYGAVPEQHADHLAVTPSAVEAWLTRVATEK